MDTHLRQLLVASTFAVATVGVSAQTTPAPTTQSATPPPATTQAERDFEAAKAACQTERTKNALQECLRRAEDNYNRAAGVSGGPAGGTAASGGGTSSVTGSHSPKRSY